MLRLYYRISDKSYHKAKLPGSNKDICLMNFCKAFANDIFSEMSNNTTPMKIIADNCERKTIKMLMSTGIPTSITDVGNAGSLRCAFEVALEEGEEEDVVYFCEDDYLHLESSSRVLKEGVTIAEYVTLYDHPDKYTRAYGGGEVSKVMRTMSSHWRFTQSTCMTFGCKVKTLRKDKPIWDKWIGGEHPHDHKVFTELGEQGRKLAVCIPGTACHTDLTFSGTINNVMIDTWAIELMIEQLEYNLGEKNEMYQLLVGNKTGWNKLVALDALLFDKQKR